MILVVDTNRIIAALIKDGISRSIILHFPGELVTIGFSKKEIQANEGEILRKARITKEELEMILDSLLSHCTILDDEAIRINLPEAERIMGRIDKADVPFIACALLTKSPIWSDDAHFRKQSRVKVFTTKELLAHLNWNEKI